MFAKFSPDGKSVAYVYDRNIYVEDISLKSSYQSRKPMVLHHQWYVRLGE